MASTLAFRCANDPKDFSLWDAHKDAFRKLFLVEGKSLVEVKSAMERNGFPVTNVKTYEVVLREHFRFRKNLEAGQWLLVGQELDKWKSQGLDCVVSFSGITQDPRLVDRKVRRERAEAARGKLKYSKSQRFPDAVTIIPKADCTLQSAGPTPQNTVHHLETLFSPLQEPEPTSNNLAALMSLTDPRLSQKQLSHDAQVVGLQAEFVAHLLQVPIGKVYRTLQENVPSRQLVSFLHNLWKGSSLSPKAILVLAETLNGLINMIQSMAPLENQRASYLRIFGPNTSFSVLETACRSFCNLPSFNLASSLLLPIRQWIATVADIAVLQQFFGITIPAVASMWSVLIRNFRSDRSAYSIMIEVALRVRHGKWLQHSRKTFLRWAIFLGDQNTVESLIDSWQDSAGIAKTPIITEEFFETLTDTPANTASVSLIVRLYSKLQASQQVLGDTLATMFWKLGRSQAAAVHWLVREGAKIQPAISDWIPSCAQKLPHDWNSAEALGEINSSDLGDIFSGEEALRPTCKDILGTYLPFLGVLASARSGREALCRFMSTLSTDAPPERERLLLLALTETTRQHDFATTNLLLETGTFLHMEPFRRNPWRPDGCRHSWKLSRGRRLPSDPVLLSAVKFDNEILQLLLSHKLFENYKLSDILQEMSLHSSEDRRHEWQATVDFLLETQRSNLKDLWDEVPDSEIASPRGLIRDYVQRRVSCPRAPSMEARNLLCTLFPNDTLQETVKHGFGIDAIESLVASGIHLPSDPPPDGNTLLIDALLSCSRDRYQIVHFLLRNGADPCQISPNFTVLEATLCFPRGVLGRNCSLDDRAATLTLFRELSQLGAPFERKTTRTAPCRPPLLSMLIRHGADISLLHQAVAAGAKINEHGTEHSCSPLGTAVLFINSETVEWLLKQGADVNARAATSDHFMDHLTALEYAILNTDMDMVTLLLSYGAIINNPCEVAWKDLGYKRLYSAVDWAVFGEQLDILKVLLDSGGQSAYPGLSGLDGAFWEADYLGNPGILMLLEQYTRCPAESIVESVEGKLKSGELGWFQESG